MKNQNCEVWKSLRNKTSSRWRHQYQPSENSDCRSFRPWRWLRISGPIKSKDMNKKITVALSQAYQPISILFDSCCIVQQTMNNLNGQLNNLNPWDPMETQKQTASNMQHMSQLWATLFLPCLGVALLVLVFVPTSVASPGSSSP